MLFRSTGDSGEEYRERLADLELQAAKRGLGIWAHTDWDKLPLERRIERLESRMKLMEEEQRQGIDITKFYGKRAAPPISHPTNDLDFGE